MLVSTLLRVQYRIFKGSGLVAFLFDTGFLTGEVAQVEDAGAAPLGYDILSPREVRLDAFLFGEEAGRYLVALDEGHDDQFLLKMDEARLNCCFLGRTTKGRILVDGYDFGPVSRYTSR